MTPTKDVVAPQHNHDHEQPLALHLKELRRRLIYGFGAVIAGFLLCFAFKEHLFMVLTAPLFDVYGNGRQMIFTAVHEMFFTYLKLSFLGGFFLGFPLLLDQIWRFVVPGLYANEKKVVLPFLLATPLLFYAGGLFSYFIIMPLAIDFFFAFANDNIAPLPSVREYLSFFIKLTFGFGFAFELPVLLLILARVGVVDAQKLRWFRRYAWVIILLTAALLTPPDPISQLFLAGPMVILYEISILFIRHKPEKQKKSSKAAS